MNKPNGQFVIAPHQVAEFVRALPLAKIPGVGKVSAAKLENMGLRTCGDVQNSDLAMLLKRFGKFGVFCGSAATGLMSGKFITIGSVNRWAWSAP